MASISPFAEEHIRYALDLWRATEHIGLSSADSPEAISAFLNNNPGLSFCAFAGDDLVGTILCGTDGRRGYIHHLAVNQKVRNRGVGSGLLTQALDALARRGIDKCHAFVFHDNPYAELFWGQLGWERREDLVVYSRPTART